MSRGGNRAGLVPVHSDTAQFKYDVVLAPFSFGLEKPKSKQALQVPVELPGNRKGGDAEQDFLAFDAPAGPEEDAIPDDGAAAPPALASEDPLGEFIPLGPAPAKAIAPVEGSGRPEPLERVPWLKSLKGIRSPLMRLHQEIVEFCRYLEPSGEEAEQRAAAIARISDAVKAIWPSAEVKVFGSFATGLYLPTSDVDAVVVNSGCGDIPSGLKALAQSLIRKKLALPKSMQVIAKAKVPIVKFEEAESGYNFDISFDVANGPEAAENVRALMDSLPPMRPLVMVLKVFLQQREMNEVYSGGLGSYALLVMVAAFLQLHPTRQPHRAAGGQRFGSSSGSGRGRGQQQQQAAPLEANLGVLLLDFFRLYGRALNCDQVGVSCRRGGSFFNKRAKGFHQPERPYLLAVEDPNDPENDLGRNSYNVSRVRMAFDWAYTQLCAPCEPHASLLQRILRLDPVLFLRAPPPEHPGEEGGAGGGGRRSEQRRRDKERGSSDKHRKRRERSLSVPEGEEGQGGSGGGRHKKPKHSPGAQQQQSSRQKAHRQQQGAGGLKFNASNSGSRHIRFD